MFHVPLFSGSRKSEGVDNLSASESFTMDFGCSQPFGILFQAHKVPLRYASAPPPDRVVLLLSRMSQLLSVCNPSGCRKGATLQSRLSRAGRPQTSHPVAQSWMASRASQVSATWSLCARFRVARAKLDCPSFVPQGWQVLRGLWSNFLAPARGNVIWRLPTQPLLGQIAAGRT